MRQLLDFFKHILEVGEPKADRTGTGTTSTFGYQMRFDISGFKAPWATTKYSHPESIIRELLLFVKGTGEVDYLCQHNVTIWDEWVKPKSRVYQDLTVAERMAKVKKKDREAANAAFDAFRETLYSEEEVPGWEFMPLTGKYRAPDINDQLHKWIDENTDVSRQKLIKGTLGGVYGVQWRNWPVSKENRPLSRRSAGRAVEAIAKFDEIKTRFADPTDFDLWLLKANTPTAFEPETDVDDGVIAGWLVEHGYALTEDVVVSSIDQFAKAIHKLKNDPDSRSIIVSAWNPAELADMALEPCHSLFQFYSNNLNKRQLVDVIWRSPLLRVALMQLLPPNETERDYDKADLIALDIAVLREWAADKDLPTRGLSCSLYQRSADAFLGVPFNISSYSLLTKMFAQVVNMEPLEFIWTGGDCHIYDNHVEQVKLQLEREPKEGPSILLNVEVTDIDQFEYKDFELVNYNYWPSIPAPKAV
jgi:thymidylate synthase